MQIPTYLLIISTIIEVFLLTTIIFIFYRLKRSEDFLLRLKQSQKELLDKLSFNEQIEKELVKSFEERQRELMILDSKLEKKLGEAREILKQLEEASNSPKVLKEIIISGYKNGESLESLAKRTGLSIEEIEWILEQQNL
ncbi:hypothetical protein JCM13304A_17780 [Desulfothermus okinawensis JCM 13304]